MVGARGRHARRVTARTRAAAVGLVLAMVLAAVAIWTASPLLWLWVASQADSGSTPSMRAIGIVLLGIVFTTLALGKLLAVLHARYRDLRGTRATVKLHLPWLRSLRSERVHERGGEVELTVLDVILISSVFVAVGAYELWFLFYSTSPFDARTGRG